MNILHLHSSLFTLHSSFIPQTSFVTHLSLWHDKSFTTKEKAEQYLNTLK